jgi:hypothetical protein
LDALLSTNKRAQKIAKLQSKQSIVGTTTANTLNPSGLAYNLDAEDGTEQGEQSEAETYTTDPTKNAFRCFVSLFVSAYLVILFSD